MTDTRKIWTPEEISVVVSLRNQGMRGGQSLAALAARIPCAGSSMSAVFLNLKYFVTWHEMLRKSKQICTYFQRDRRKAFLQKTTPAAVVFTPNVTNPHQAIRSFLPFLRMFGALLVKPTPDK